MPQFQLDTDTPSDSALPAWESLDGLTQGYLEAMFFMNCSSSDDGELEGKGYSDLNLDSLVKLNETLVSVEGIPSWSLALTWAEVEGLDRVAVGRDIYFTAAGHGVGFYDRDIPYKLAEALTSLTDALDLETSPDLDDDGRVYLERA